MTTEEILDAIEEADRAQIDLFLEAVTERKQELWPEWEIGHFALEKKLGKEAWQEVWELLQQYRGRESAYTDRHVPSGQGESCYMKMP